MHQATSKRVLLIDYDPHSIGHIRSLLRASGYEIHIAKNGGAGVESFERLQPDLTLVQDLLPGTSGEEVCEAIKSTDQGQSASVVRLVPGCKRRSDHDNRWCDVVVETPFSDAALLAVVRKLIGKGTIAAAASGGAKRSTPEIPVEFNDSELSMRLESIMPRLPESGAD